MGEGAATGVRPRSKRSFLELPVDIDVASLVRDYNTIPPEAWGASYWAESAHCSIDMVLLRGGTKGGPDDFSATVADVRDSPFLARLPSFAKLVSEDGPFGLPVYAFLFRMRPRGITRIHRDRHPAWYEPFRIHVPIISNPGARLLSEGRSIHLATGSAWSFDNQRDHAVVNGDETRVHLIMDVPAQPRLNGLLDRARCHSGELDDANWKRCRRLPMDLPEVPFECQALSPEEKGRRGVPLDGLASRVTAVDETVGHRMRSGDVILSVNGTYTDPTTSDARQFIRAHCVRGDVVSLEIDSEGRKASVRLPPLSGPFAAFGLLRRGWRSLVVFGLDYLERRQRARRQGGADAPDA